MRFRVEAHEDVTATYLVDAADEAEVRRKLGDPETAWDDVEQVEYIAFSRDIKNIVEQP